MAFDLEAALASPPPPLDKEEPRQSGFDLDAALSTPPPPIEPQTASKGFDMEAALKTPPPPLEPANGQETPPVRIPADDPSQKPFGMLDSLKAGVAGVGAGIAGEGIPFLKEHITSPVERSGRQMGLTQRLANVGSSMAETLTGALAGPAGAGAAAAYNTLASNAEQRRIALEREADQKAMREGTLTPLPVAVPGAYTQSWKETDAGDITEAAINGVVTAMAMRFGGKSDEVMKAAIAQGAKPLIAAGVNALRQAGFDAASAIPSAVAARANAENMTLSDWTNPEKVARVLNPEELLKEAGAQAALSVGAQIPGAVKTRNELRAADNVAERQRITDVETRAAQTRDLVEQERIATQRVQAEQVAREAERNALAAAEARNRQAFEQRQEEIRAQQEIDRIRRDAQDAPPLKQKLDPEIEALVGPIRERYQDGRYLRPLRPLQEGYTSRELSPVDRGPSPAAQRARLGIDVFGARREAEASARAIYEQTLQAELQRRGIAPVTQQEVLLLPAPEGRSPDVDDGFKMLPETPVQKLERATLSTRKGGGSSELPTREGQGQEARRSFGLSPLRRQSQEIAATPATAGEGVINQRGEQVQLPGEPARRGFGMLRREQGPSSPIEPKTEFNPELGQMKTSTLGDAEQAVIDISHTDANALQRARRATTESSWGGKSKMVRPIDQIKSDAETIARQRGADLVAGWKPGQAFNAEELGAVKAYTGAINAKIAELESRADSFWNPSTRKEILNAHEEFYKATAALVGGKSEMGRAMRFWRESMEPVQYDPQTGTPVKPKASDSPNILPEDRKKAAEYLTKLYGDKPVPQSVIDEIASLKPDDAEGLFNILKRQTKINNKTGIVDAVTNFIRAGMLSGPKTLMRNFGGIITNAGARDGDSRLASVIDWAMSKKTGRRTVTSIGLGKSLSNLKSGVKEGASEGWDVLLGKKPSTAEMRSSMERMEFGREQYTGDSIISKAADKSTNFMFRLMAAADLPARKFAAKQSIINQAQVIAKNEVASGAIPKTAYKKRVEELVSDPTDVMLLEAALQGEKAVFADKNLAVNGLTLARNFIYGHLDKRGPLGKIGAASLKGLEAVITPFLKTPANITWDVAQRVLLELPKGSFTGLWVALRKTPMTDAEQKLIAESMARGGIGLGIAITGYILGKKGVDWVSGTSEQESTGMRETHNLAGMQPGSVTFFGMNARVQDAFSPASNLLALGYSIGREKSKRLTNEDSRMGNMIAAGAKAITESPMLQGAERLSKIGEPGGVQRFAVDSASAVVPAIVSDVASAFDDRRRDARKQPGDTFGDVLAKSFMRKIPGLRNKLPARVDALGNIQPERLKDVIDPTYMREARWQNDKAIGELVRLDVGMPKPTRRENETEEQFLARIKENGDKIKQIVDNVVSSPRYDTMSDEQKYNMLYNATHYPSINTISGKAN